MSQHRKNIFLTLVLCFCGVASQVSALPQAELPPDKIETNLLRPSANPAQDILIPSRRIYRDGLFTGLGLWSGSLSTQNTTESTTFIMLGKKLTDEIDSSEEITLRFLLNGLAGWHYGKKWSYETGYRQEPFYQLGVGSLYTFSENIGTFINWKRYFISGSIGFDDLLSWDRQFRAELGLTISALGSSYYFNFEYAF